MLQLSAPYHAPYHAPYPAPQQGASISHVRGLLSFSGPTARYGRGSGVLALCLLSSLCLAQDLAGSTRVGLPDAPGFVSEEQSGPQAPEPEAHASISGTVTDTNGSLISGAQVTLFGNEATVKGSTVSDALGKFSFSGLAAGTFRVTIESSGLRSFHSNAIVLKPGEVFEMPPAALPVPTTTTDVEVSSAIAEIAKSQVQLEEKQRVLGILPNFYTSYIWDAAPLTPKLKFNLALRAVTDPVAFGLTGAVAGVEQWHKTFPGYGTGADGYAKRYGAAYADNVIGRMIGSALLPSLFHQDPRYFYKGKGTIVERARYAVGASFIARGDNGRAQPNYSHLLGNFAAAGISNLYRAPGDRSASLTVRNALIITGSHAAGNLVREFLLKKLTSKVPPFAQGEP